VNKDIHSYSVGRRTVNPSYFGGSAQL